MAVRKIVKIDEALCDGCGDCVPSCAEGAIQIVDGVARLVSEVYCDGLGACLGVCPQGAITVEERVAAAFDEEAVKRHLVGMSPSTRPSATPRHQPHVHGGMASGCPSARVMQVRRPGPAGVDRSDSKEPLKSVLSHWPVKLKLVPPGARFLEGADLLLLADCVPVAFAALHRELLPGRAVVIGCPKFDDYEFSLRRLTDIICHSDVRSLTVVHMEVPCCFGYWQIAHQAHAAAGKPIPLEQVVIGVDGEVRKQSPFAMHQHAAR